MEVRLHQGRERLNMGIDPIEEVSDYSTELVESLIVGRIKDCLSQVLPGVSRSSSGWVSTGASTRRLHDGREATRRPAGIGSNVRCHRQYISGLPGVELRAPQTE